MAITLDGTNGINSSGVIVAPAGSASAPSITNDGDTNTGIFFPAADTIAFAEGGAEAMRIDSSGNVGIGTSSPSFKLQVNGFIGVTDGTSTVRLANSGGVGLVSTITNHPLAFQTNDTERARITSDGLFQFNSGYGSVATAYGCRAWVNFNGTGTVAIRASGNVSSITDNGTGNYTVNFTTAITDDNYAAVGTCEQASGGGQLTVSKEYATAPTTTAFALICRTGSNAASDPRFVYVAIFR